MRQIKDYEKEPVTVRYKELKNGNLSVYLDIYFEGRRKYEFLKLYLLPEEGRNKMANKVKNKETMRVVATIKAQRVLDIKNGMAGIESKNQKMLLSEWIKTFLDYKANTAKSVESVKTTENMTKHLLKYKGGKIAMGDIDKRFCLGFISYLSNVTKRGGQPLSDTTKKVYFTSFGNMLNKAVREGIIPMNPISQIDKAQKIATPETQRVYLEIDELKKLAETDCYSILTKQAFMFSCLCGLRISDIRRLKWSDIEKYQDKDGVTQYRLFKNMQKTKRNVSYQLPREAVKWLPKKTDGLVFQDLCMESNINIHLKRWAKDAGITKDISFHTARHTFATMMLTLGADIYTTSKLLGHSRVSTTEIYAKIIDKKKDEAMGLIDKYFDK